MLREDEGEEMPMVAVLARQIDPAEVFEADLRHRNELLIDNALGVHPQDVMILVFEGSNALRIMPTIHDANAFLTRDIR